MKEILTLATVAFLVGCSASSQVEVKKPENIEIDIMFKMNQKKPSNAVIRYITDVSGQIVQTPYEQITIVGFTDQTGSQKQNIKLSTERAYRVRDIFHHNGVPNEKMLAYGLGAVNLKTDCRFIKNQKEKMACHNKNRRVEVTVEY